MIRQYRFASCAIVIVWMAALGPAVSKQARKASARSASQAQESAFSRRPFSADITIVGKQGTYRGKIYAEPGALRTDVKLSNGTDASVIERYDKGVEWILTPGRHYFVAPINETDDLLSALRNRAARVKRQDLGPAKVGAYPCEEYRVEVAVKRRKLSGWIWVARARAMDGFIVKAKDQTSGESVELSNIRLERPNSSLFNLPAGYSRLTTPSAKPKATH